VPPQPLGPLQVEFKLPTLHGTMISFADVDYANHGKNRTGIARAHGLIVHLGGSCHGEAHGIPCPIRWRPGTTAGIAKIAECFENIQWRDFRLMTRSGAVATPSRSQRKP